MYKSENCLGVYRSHCLLFPAVSALSVVLGLPGSFPEESHSIISRVLLPDPETEWKSLTEERSAPPSILECSPHLYPLQIMCLKRRRSDLLVTEGHYV